MSRSRRDQHAAERFLHRVLDAEDGVEPRVVVTDKLANYVPAIKRVLTNTEHRRHKRLNNRAENSHRPVRSASGRYSGSNHPSRRSDSWRPSARPATTSVHVGTVFQLGATARSCASDSYSGARSPVWRQQLGPQPERSASGRHRLVSQPFPAGYPINLSIGCASGAADDGPTPTGTRLAGAARSFATAAGVAAVAPTVGCAAAKGLVGLGAASTWTV